VHERQGITRGNFKDDRLRSHLFQSHNLSAGSRTVPPLKSECLPHHQLPVCNDSRVEKALSTFAIKRLPQKRKMKTVEVDPRQVMRLIQDYVNKNCEDVSGSTSPKSPQDSLRRVKKEKHQGNGNSRSRNAAQAGGSSVLQDPHRQTPRQLTKQCWCECEC